jgi:serine/threonine protein kinase
VTSIAAPPPLEVTLLSPSLTSTGALLGTPLYLPPEAWLGAAPTVSMDLYSLGALVYELCTSDRPHHGHTLEQIRQDAQARDAEPLGVLVPGIDAGFAAAIDRCLQREPAARWASADALCARLEAALLRAARPRGVACTNGGRGSRRPRSSGPRRGGGIAGRPRAAAPAT